MLRNGVYKIYTLTLTHWFEGKSLGVKRRRNFCRARRSAYEEVVVELDWKAEEKSAPMLAAP